MKCSTLIKSRHRIKTSYIFIKNKGKTSTQCFGNLNPNNTSKKEKTSQQNKFLAGIINEWVQSYHIVGRALA